MQQAGNRVEYQPPDHIAARCIAKPATSFTVRFPDLSHSDQARKLVLVREQAVKASVELQAGRKTSFGKVHARAEIAAQFKGQLPISMRSLERWERLYRDFGLDGLVEQKRGRSGKKSPELPENLRRLGQALAHDHGSIARGARALAAHPELPADSRKILHGAHASKSYVAPSIRAQLRISDLTSALAQGPRAARLASPFTVRDWSQFAAGRIFTADDMTSNVVCWMEWPNKQGWIIRQPQVLAVMDVGSLRWLNVRCVVRESGQYTADDVWGLFGDVFDTFGLPHEGLLLEFGSWQSNAVKGKYTGTNHDDRIGGLSSLGLRIFPSFDPRSKGMLETMFNQLQHEMDRFPGWIGRCQRYDKPEWIALAMRECEAGRHHPREFFPHLKELSDHVQNSMANLNQERNDGNILRGRTPLDKWAEDAPCLRQLPDYAKWLYRAACDPVKVTRNGFTIKRGSGARTVSYNYFNPALVAEWQRQTVIVYWNDKNPETDAVILNPRGKTFLGLAQYRAPLKAFDATSDELQAERRLKRETLHYARTELRAIQPELHRGPVIVSPAGASTKVGQQIRASADRAASAETSRAATRREISKVEVTREDLGAALDSEPQETRREDLSSEQIADLFSTDPET